MPALIKSQSLKHTRFTIRIHISLLQRKDNFNNTISKTTTTELTKTLHCTVRVPGIKARNNSKIIFFNEIKKFVDTKQHQPF